MQTKGLTRESQTFKREIEREHNKLQISGQSSLLTSKISCLRHMLETLDLLRQKFRPSKPKNVIATDYISLLKK